MCPPGFNDHQGGGVMIGGVPSDLLFKFKSFDWEACTFLYNLHKYLVGQPGVRVDQGFKFENIDQLMQFRHRFWSNSAERPEWMSESFGAFKRQLRSCQFIHHDTADKLTWVHHLFTKEEPDYVGIINDKKGGSNTHSGNFVLPTSPAQDVLADLSNTQQDLLPSSIVKNLHAKVTAIQSINRTMLSYKSTPKVVLKHLTNLEDDLVFFEGGINKLARHFEVDQPAARLAQVIECLLTKGVQRWAPDLQLSYGKTVVECCCPLIGLPMNVYQLRDAIYGDTIARVLDFCHVNVFLVNQLVDYGNPFIGVLIEYLMETIPCWEVADKSAVDMEVFLNGAESRLAQDSVFEQKALKAMSHYERGDEKYKQAWLKLREISRMNFNEIYSRVGMSLQEVPASDYRSLVPETVEELLALEVVKDAGSSKVFLDAATGKEVGIVDADGNYSISAIYLSALSYRLTEIEADRILYVANTARKSFFEAIFSAAKLADWFGDAGAIHVALNKAVFGDIDPSCGVVGLLDGLLCHCLEMLDGKAEKYEWSGEELQQIAETIGYGALKYANLRIDREKTCKFSYADMLDPEGNTAVKLQRAHARIRNITKSYKEIEHLRRTESIVLGEPEEYALAAHLVRFTAAVEETCLTLKPHFLCEYLETLSEHFLNFLAACPVVVESSEEISRVLLCEATGLVFQECFSLFGIKSVQDVKETMLD